MIGPYLVAVFAMLFSGLSALTLIYAVGHFDDHAEEGTPGEATGQQAGV